MHSLPFMTPTERPRCRSVAAFLLFAAAAILAGCARKTPDPAPTKPPAVTVIHPISRMISDYEDFTGRTEPVRMVELKARVTGYLQGVYFKDGQDIAEGKPLFDIDRRLYKADFDRATAALEKANKHHITMTSNYEREKGLQDRGSGSKEAFDQAVGALAEARADIDVATAALELAAANLQFTRVAAPFDGRLSKRLVDPGNLVKADDTSLTSIVALDPLYATFDVDERTVMKFRALIRKGEIKSSREEPRAVLIGTADSDTEFPHSGLITFTDNQIDAGTGTLRVRAEIRNPKLDRPPWYMLSPGQFLRVRLPVGNPRAGLLVPEKSLGVDQGQKYIYIVKEKEKDPETGKVTKWEAQRRNVRLGPQYGTFFAAEVISSKPEDQLKETDLVIVDGLPRVRDGGPVGPKPDATTLPEAVIAPLEMAPLPRGK